LNCAAPTRRELLGLAGAAFFARPLRVDTRSFWLFRLLNPKSLIVRPVGTARLHCSTTSREWIIEGAQFLSVSHDSDPIRISGPAGEAVDCTLGIPGLMQRDYHGRFELRGDGEIVLPIMTMNCEIATGSVIAAELPLSAAAPAALCAHAVVSRSVICAATPHRHAGADFCDTTHCQFLRSPAPPGSAAESATDQTHGTVLYQNGAVIPALYSAACGGHTEAGRDRGFAYISVPCESCQRGRAERRGHGWGLCQQGAMALAREGWNWREILAKYYPNTVPLAA
jgi:hypothetical protein